MASDIFHWF